jgi:hypothetical protein
MFDFPYYHDGGYSPQGYYCFTGSWIFIKDYTDFLNVQLAKGYYLVSPSEEFRYFREVTVNLHYRNIKETGNFVVLSNTPAS